MGYSKRDAPKPKEFEWGYQDAAKVGYTDLTIMPEGLERGAPKQIQDYREPASVSYLMGLYDLIDARLHGISENIFDEEEREQLEQSLDNRLKALERYIESERRKTSNASLKQALVTLGTEHTDLRPHLRELLRSI